MLAKPYLKLQVGLFQTEVLVRLNSARLLGFAFTSMGLLSLHLMGALVLISGQERL